MEEVILVNAPEFNIRDILGEVKGEELVGGALGAVAVLAVPNYLKQTGLIGVGISALTAVLGGYGIRKYINPHAGTAFAVVGLSITAIKLVKTFVAPKLGEGILEGVGDQELFGNVGEELFGEEQVFGQGNELFGEELFGQVPVEDIALEDELVPTFTGY